MRVFTLIQINEDDIGHLHNFYCSNDLDEIIEDIDEYVNKIEDEGEQDQARDEVAYLVDVLRKMSEYPRQVALGQHPIQEPYILLVSDV